MQLSSGITLQNGRYQIVRVLGQGGFGITYLGYQVGLNRFVAIKEFFMKEYCNRDTVTSKVFAGSDGSKDTVDRYCQKFIKEARIIAKLKHPNIVNIYDVFEENGTAYYVMQYLDRGSLADYQEKKGTLSEQEALYFIRQVADALKYIHQNKVNHLDVKPSNILLNDQGGVVLIDFGMSKQYRDDDAQTSTTPVGISHGYAPLEQYKMSGVSIFSPATDIYSLGATFYKLITGCTPPDANDIMETGLSAFPENVSKSTVQAITQAMQPLRRDRSQTVDDFMALLNINIKRKVVSQQNEDTVRDTVVDKTSLLQSSDDSRVQNTDSAQELPLSKESRKFVFKPVWKWVVFFVVFSVFLWWKGDDSTDGKKQLSSREGVVDSIVATDSQKNAASRGPVVSKFYATTTPDKAAVFIDGENIGETPIEGINIPCGSFLVVTGG